MFYSGQLRRALVCVVSTRHKDLSRYDFSKGEPAFRSSQFRRVGEKLRESEVFHSTALGGPESPRPQLPAVPRHALRLRPHAMVVLLTQLLQLQLPALLFEKNSQ